MLALCKKVSKETAKAIWDREGSVEENKNRTFQPTFAEQAGYDDPVRKICINECASSERSFPEQFRRLHPAFEGRLFIDFPRLDYIVCYPWNRW